MPQPALSPDLDSQSDVELYVRPAVRFEIVAGIAFIVVVTSLVYLPSWNGGFIFDDYVMLVDNPRVTAPDGLYRIWFTKQSQDYWPLTYSTFWLQWRLWGNDPTGYHLVNLALHIGESLLVWLILSRLSIPGAFLAATLFALHPVNVESVAWISQQKNTISLLFFLLSILCYLQFDRSLTKRENQPEEECAPSNFSNQRGNPGWYFLSLIAFALGNLSKGSVAILHLILLVLVWWRRKIERSDLIRIAPFFVLAAAFTAVNIWFQSLAAGGIIRNVGIMERILGAGAVVWFYLSKALWPFDLAFIYPQWHIEPDCWLWWLPLGAALALTALLLWKRRTTWGRSLLLAWAFFCIALLPVMGFTRVGFMQFSLVADHYLHIAIIGVLALVAAVWSRWRQRSNSVVRTVAIAAAAVVVALFGCLSWRQSSLYQNARTMYQAALQKNPDCWVLHADLGDILVQSGENQAAVNELNEALRFNPDCDAAHCNLGTAWANLGNFPEAVAQLQKAIQLNPNLYEAYHQLTMVYAQTDRPNDALATADKALALARSNGMKELASKIETWEEKFKAEHPRAVDSGSQPGRITNQH